MYAKRSVVLTCLIMLLFAPLLFGIGAVTVESFVYMGLDSDKVGSGGNTQPDGVPDAHFVLTLRIPSPVQIQSLKLQLIDKAGNPLDAYYQSQEYGYAWILGVYEGRQMLNPMPSNTLGIQMGSVTYDLYANDSGVFQSDASFRLDIQTSKGKESTAIALNASLRDEKPVPASYTKVAVDRVLFRGFDADKVGSWATAEPDGTPDAHFTALLQLPSSTEIQSMSLTHTDAKGNSLGSFWLSRDYDSAYILGAYVDGRFINPRAGVAHGRFSGDVAIDLYAQDSGVFQKNEYFTLEISTDRGYMKSSFILTDPVAAIQRAATTAPPKASVPSQASIGSLRWAGNSVDKVGSWDQAAPDGYGDGHFVLTLTLPPNSTIEYVSLHLADHSGVRYPSYWYTDSTYSWILGAYMRGALLNAGRQKPLARSLAGTVVLDLYAANDGSQVSGSYYLVDVSVNGTIYTAAITIP